MALPVGAKESTQFAQLTPDQQELIYSDLAKNGVVDDGTPVSININNGGKTLIGPMFASDVPAGPLASVPDTATATGALGAPAPAPAQGALAQTTRAPMFDMQEMLKQYMPQDDSQSKWLALAAGLGQGTRTGSFGETLGNVAGAMQAQKEQQAKLRSQYVPLIMQQVAAQQAREEQAAYRQQAQQLQIQEAQRAQTERLEALRSAQQAQLTQAAQLAKQAQDARAQQVADQIAARAFEGSEGRASREALAAQQKADSAKAPAGFAWGPNDADGRPTMYRVSGGPADLKASAAAELKAAGASDVDSAVASLRDAYNRLETGGGITSTKEGSLSNIAAATSASGPGQLIGKMLGTQNQSARNDIAMTRPALLAALMKATGMSAKQMDSNAELKLWLATATDPTLDVESNRRALDAIERKYLGSKDAPPAAASPQLPTMDAIAAEIARRKKG
jgi:hypothetical protein